MSPSLQQLVKILHEKENLNADFSFHEMENLFALAEDAGAEAFEPVAEEVLRMIDLYRATPQQRFGKEILAEYFQALEQSARLLTESGEITSRPPEMIPESVFSKALVLQNANVFSALDRCKILNRSQIPQTLTRAADAFRRRIEVVDSVIEIGFQLLQRIDEPKFHAWITDYLSKNEGSHEPELIRDILKVLRKSTSVSQPLLEWVVRWSNDEAILEQWPRVVALSDQVLCRETLLKWNENAPARNSILAHLKLLVRNGKFDEKNLRGWLANALEEFGAGIHRFLTLKLDDSQEAQDWMCISLKTELQRLAALYPPIMIVCGESLTQPEGPQAMALAFLGLTGKSKEDWEKQILTMAEKVVLRIFLTDLKEGRKPVETIRKLTFGDDVAFNIACSNLDLVSQSFDSTAQRRKVVKQLAVFYASYRRTALLGAEVSKRYRSIMRILHEDFLKNILSEEDWKDVEQTGVLHDLSAMASAARRYIDHRRALHLTVEEILSSGIEFVQETRTRRMGVIRQLLAQE